MTLRNPIGAVRRRLWSWFHRRVVPLGGSGPIVSFTFDDFPRSALTAGAPILEKFGARGTYYVAMALMNQTNQLGEQFRLEDLYSLVERGHELASHTFSHLSSHQAECEIFRRDAEAGEKAIQENSGIPASNNFAYPYGEATLKTKRALGRMMTSCRGTCAGLNGPDLDLNLLRANYLYGGVEKLEAAKQLILRNEVRQAWLIFYTHDVSAHPSAFGCTPELLEAVASFVAERGVRMRTVAQVMGDLAQHRTGQTVQKEFTTQ
jgi:peptidoglycan/xylan/chitin deacetylase (PgdA/CDA1 family)